MPALECTARKSRGDATRKWTENRVLVFDDSYEHEAWNRTGQRRAVIIMAAYHPDLSLDEIGAFQMLQPLFVESYRAYLEEQGRHLGRGGAPGSGDRRRVGA